MGNSSFLSLSAVFIFIFSLGINESQAFKVATNLKEAEQSVVILENPHTHTASGQGVALNILAKEFPQAKNQLLTIATALHVAIFHLLEKNERGKYKYIFEGELCDSEHGNQGFRAQVVHEFGIKLPGPSHNVFLKPKSLLVIPCPSDKNKRKKFNKIFKNYISFMNDPLPKNNEDLQLITKEHQDLTNFCLGNDAFSDVALVITPTHLIDLIDKNFNKQILLGDLQPTQNNDQTSLATLLTDPLTRTVFPINNDQVKEKTRIDFFKQNFAIEVISSHVYPVNEGVTFHFEPGTSSFADNNVATTGSIASGDSGSPLYLEEGNQASVMGIVSCTLKSKAYYLKSAIDYKRSKLIECIDQAHQAESFFAGWPANIEPKDVVLCSRAKYINYQNGTLPNLMQLFIPLHTNTIFGSMIQKLKHHVTNFNGHLNKK